MKVELWTLLNFSNNYSCKNNRFNVHLSLLQVFY